VNVDDVVSSIKPNVTVTKTLEWSQQHWHLWQFGAPDCSTYLPDTCMAQL